MDINQETFDKLLSHLEPDLPNSEARYKQLRLKMTKFFEWRHCNDSEELADETITRVVNQLAAGKEILAENPYAYFYGVAKNVYREFVRRQINKEKILDNLPEQTAPSQDWQDCRDQCLQKLPADKLELLQHYYLNIKGREALAQQLNLTLNALRLKVHRLKKELRTCYEDCRKKISRTGN